MTFYIIEGFFSGINAILLEQSYNIRCLSFEPKFFIGVLERSVLCNDIFIAEQSASTASTKRIEPLQCYFSTILPSNSSKFMELGVVMAPYSDVMILNCSPLNNWFATYIIDAM